jgi:hypothetical protein
MGEDGGAFGVGTRVVCSGSWHNVGLSIFTALLGRSFSGLH